MIHTTKGDIGFELYPEKVRKTVENFTGLARKGYYDGVIFHRVIPKFVRPSPPLALLSTLNRRADVANW